MVGHHIITVTDNPADISSLFQFSDHLQGIFNNMNSVCNIQNLINRVTYP